MGAMAVAFVVGGCGRSGSNLMPLEVGRSWTYLVQSGFNSYVDEVKVTRRLSVASSPGAELSGPLGTTRMAWHDGALLVEQAINTQFVPPLPILFDASETSDRAWKGTATLIGSSAPARATQEQSVDSDFMADGGKIRTIKSTLHLERKGHDIELITWFAPDRGILQQEQRTDGVLVVRAKQLDH